MISIKKEYFILLYRNDVAAILQAPENSDKGDI